MKRQHLATPPPNPQALTHDVQCDGSAVPLPPSLPLTRVRAGVVVHNAGERELENLASNRLHVKSVERHRRFYHPPKGGEW